ncbi:MAG: hypothetical protein J6J23_02845, partial [Clostridia bacterium]|nr:hypothetical protein [Clostridia bacterium]
IDTGRQNMLLKKASHHSTNKWLELFKAYFKEHPKATSIPKGTHIIGSKMRHLKEAFNNGQGSPSANEQIIINWFISTGRQNMLKLEKNTNTPLSSDEWIQLFDTYLKENPNATTIPGSAPVVGNKMGDLKKAYNNGQGSPSDDVKIIIDWFINTGRKNFLLINKDRRKSSDKWIKLFEAYLKEHPNATSIPKSTPVIGSKFEDIREEYDNGNGSPSADAQKIIDWFNKTGRLNLLKKEDATNIQRSPDEWIEIYEAYFKQHPNATTITKRTPIVGLKLISLRVAYNNGKGKPSADAQKIIDWFVNTGRKDFLKKEEATNIQRSPDEWIRLFDEYFKLHPDATSIPYKTPDIGSKIAVLKQEYNNGQGTPTPDTQKIIDWFINTGRGNFLLLTKKNKKDGALGDDDDQTM